MPTASPAVKRQKDKRKKAPKKVFSRRAQTGFAAAPADNWNHFHEYVRLEVDRKDIVFRVKSHIKEKYKDDKDTRSFMLSATDTSYGTCYAFAGILAWRELSGKPDPKGWRFERVEELAFDKIRESANRKLAASGDSDSPKKASKSPMDIIRERTSQFIGGVEEVLDTFGTKEWSEYEKYSIYDELKKADAAANLAKGTYDYYVPLRNEIQELINLPKKKNDEQEQLAEAYRNMTAKERKAYLKFIESVLSDSQRYLDSKKAMRKTRKPVVKSAEKQADKVVYLKESAEYKVTSISPARIVGAERVYLFNEKERYIIELKTNSGKGFQISGTTIKQIDEENSRATRLRKPNEFLPIILGKTPIQIDKEWKKLTTKPAAFTGRINRNTIILRVSEK